jgi:membrane complex biogenesis BtpA family protein
MYRKAFHECFHHPKPLIGMVHLLPLPGSPRGSRSLSGVVERAVQDARRIVGGGMDGLLVENYGDAPFLPWRVGPETVAAMTCVIREIQRFVDKPLGINVLRNDAQAALAMATILGCDFIRVNVHVGVVATDQGILEGKAFDTLRYREVLRSEVRIFADVFVKHDKTLDREDIGQAAEEAVSRGLADAVVVTGIATGESVSLDGLDNVRKAVPDVPVLAGSGVSTENLEHILSRADGAIVGTAIKEDGRTENDINESRVRALVEERNGLLST